MHPMKKEASKHEKRKLAKHRDDGGSVSDDLMPTVDLPPNPNNLQGATRRPPGDNVLKPLIMSGVRKRMKGE